MLEKVYILKQSISDVYKCQSTFSRWIKRIVYYISLVILYVSLTVYYVSLMVWYVSSIVCYVSL